MKMPWHDQTGLSRAVAILGMIFGIALGLCGLNAAAASSHQWSGGTVLMVTGVIELAGIVIPGAALLLIGLFATIRAIFRFFQN